MATPQVQPTADAAGLHERASATPARSEAARPALQGQAPSWAQGKLRLHFDDGTMTTMSLDIKPGLSGAYTMVLTVTVDPEHEFDQSGFTSDDSISVTVIVPTPRPTQATNVDCM